MIVSIGTVWLEEELTDQKHLIDTLFICEDEPSKADQRGTVEVNEEEQLWFQLAWGTAAK